MDEYLPAERFAREMLVVLTQGDITIAQLAHTLGVHPDWLHKVVAGEITELPVLTVVCLCQRPRIMPEDLWDAAFVARVFEDFPANTFDGDEAG